jgi:hypothetical protein
MFIVSLVDNNNHKESVRTTKAIFDTEKEALKYAVELEHNNLSEVIIACDKFYKESVDPIDSKWFVTILNDYMNIPGHLEDDSLTMDEWNRRRVELMKIMPNHYSIKFSEIMKGNSFFITTNQVIIMV